MNSPAKLLGLIAILAIGFSTANAQPVPPGWEKLANCRLAPGEYMDGDSFHVLHNGKNHIFRLYFVDCAETDASFPQRVQDQMEDFGLSNQAAVLKAGEQAKEFTKKMLAGPFTVLTKWEDARGNSKQKRNYAVILIGSKNLAEELARAGWARAYGMPADFPSADRSKQFRDSLRRLQANAIRGKLGAFAGTSRVMAAGETAVPEREYVDYESEIGGQILNDGIQNLDMGMGLE
ncbi:MAG: thermonuclease family protein [Verrucomicrobiota bacterium]